jgi:hypothetical protein
MNIYFQNVELMLHARNTIENKTDLIDQTITQVETFFGKVKFFY